MLSTRPYVTKASTMTTTLLPSQSSGSTMTADAPEFVPRSPAATTPTSNGSSAVNNRKRPLANPSMVPQAPRVPKTQAEKESTRRLYIVLSQACLETYQISSGGGGSGAARRDGRYDGQGEARYTLLNCDDHVREDIGVCTISLSLADMSVLLCFAIIPARNPKQDEQRGGDCAAGHHASGIPAQHIQGCVRYILTALRSAPLQCLLTLLDSPLNKAGLLQVYIHTAKGVLIEVNPSVRIPRTFKRFAGLMGRYKLLCESSIQPN